MLYKFRWIYAAAVACLMLAAGFIADVLPLWSQLHAANQQAAQLTLKVTQLPQTKNNVMPLQTEKIYPIPTILQMAAQQKIIIKQLNELANQHIHLLAQGGDGHLLFFINQLLLQNTFAEFSLQVITNNQMELIAEIIPLSLTQPVTASIRSSPHSPFCWQMKASEKTIDISPQKIIFHHANLSDAILLLAKYSHRNVVVSSQVMGQITLQLYNVQPDQVFALLLEMYGLEKWEQGDIWYVATQEELIKRKQQTNKWQTLTYESAPLQTQSWQIHYGKASDIARMLQDGKSSFLSPRGQVRVDDRTNIICVQDVAERIQAIQKLIAKFDQPAQQVRIEARLASVDSDKEHELGIDFDVKTNHSDNAPGRYSIAVAHLPDGSLLDVKLAALENSGHANLISSPSLYTANQQTAAIEAGEEVPYQEVSEGGGTAIAFKKAVLGLKVTPQVLPGGYVLLQLRINQDRPASRMVLGMPTISTRQILTNVLVKSGQTAVLGGIYENQDEKAVRRIPLLGSVPVVGELFTLRATKQAKRELLIFVTPKIMTQPL